MQMSTGYTTVRHTDTRDIKLLTMFATNQLTSTSTNNEHSDLFWGNFTNSPCTLSFHITSTD